MTDIVSDSFNATRGGKSPDLDQDTSNDFLWEIKASFSTLTTKIRDAKSLTSIRNNENGTCPDK